MFRTVLIANRGEIACRIAATRRELGIRAVAVYSEADRGALHVRACPEALPIGPAEAAASYLNAGALVEAARKAGAEAIHPGYGFLAESPAFAAAVEAAGLAFIGPTAEQIRLLGDKRAARALAMKSGVPVVPGAEGEDDAALRRAAKKLGFPVIVKAALGGGGKGMSVVAGEDALPEAVASARRLAESAFGDRAVYLEKRLDRARHVEVQVLGDGKGEAIHLFERDCTLQRRHQKVIEESPSPAVTETLRERLAFAAVALAQAVRYRGAGTVEFLVAPDGAFYFLEMNTRLQVEHPVTECVYGVDLVEEQLRVASGLPPTFDPASLAPRGHALELRVNAEDPKRFLPGPGAVTTWVEPTGEGIRVDAGYAEGSTVTPNYDSLMAKLIVSGPDRATVLARARAAVAGFQIAGPKCNLPFFAELLDNPEFVAGDYDTGIVGRMR